MDRFSDFIYGWTQTWVAKAASIATLGTGFFYYLGDFFPGLRVVVLYTVPSAHRPAGSGRSKFASGQLLAIGVILFLAGVNYLGVRVGGGVQVAVTAVKLALIGGVIVAGLISGQGNAANFHSRMTANPGGVEGFFVALVAALWAYDGWNNAGMLGSEIEHPQKNLPRALIMRDHRHDRDLFADQPSLFLHSEPPRRSGQASASPRTPCAGYWDTRAGQRSASPP